MSRPKFTVNIPVYNAEKYLNECIESILNQSFSDFELILVDDGSKDSSGTICDEYAQKDTRIKVFHNENQGSFVSRVFSVNNAQGDFCVFCDSDDYYDLGYLERVNDILNEEKCDIVLFNQRGIENGTELPIKSCWDEKKIFEGKTKKDFYSKMMTTAFFNNLNVKVIKTSLLKNDPLDFNKYSFVKNGDDFLQSLYPIFSAKKIVFVPECFYNYRSNPDSLTHKIDPNIHNSIFAVRSVIWTYLDGTDILGEDTKAVFATRSLRSAMNIVKLVAQANNLDDNKKIEIFENLREHKFYIDFILPNFKKSELDKKWQLVYELYSRHSYKLLISTVKMLSKIKK